MTTSSGCITTIVIFVLDRLYSISLIKDFLESKTLVRKYEQAEIPQNIPVDKPIYHTQIANRSLDIYAEAGEC